MSTIRKTVRYTIGQSYFRGGRAGRFININPPLRDVISVNFTNFNSRGRYFMTNRTRNRRYGARFYIRLYNGRRVVKTLSFSVGRGRNRTSNLSRIMRRRHSLRNLTITKVEFRGDRYRGRDFTYTVNRNSSFMFEQRPKVSLNVSSEPFASYVKLDWTDPSQPRMRYRVLHGRRAVSPISYNMNAVLSSLLPGRRYLYQIQYYDSSWVTVKSVYVTTKKSRLYLVEKGTTYMKIRWDPVYTDAVYVLRVIDVASGDKEDINTQDLTHTINGMNPGQKTTFQLFVIENGSPVGIGM